MLTAVALLGAGDRSLRRRRWTAAVVGAVAATSAAAE